MRENGEDDGMNEITYESIAERLDAFKGIKRFATRESNYIKDAFVFRTKDMEVALIPSSWMASHPELRQSTISDIEWERFLYEWVKQFKGKLLNDSLCINA